MADEHLFSIDEIQEQMEMVLSSERENESSVMRLTEHDINVMQAGFQKLISYLQEGMIA